MSTLSEPRVYLRPECPYVGIRRSLRLQEIPAELPPLIPRVFGWLAAKGVAPDGAPFFKYNIIDMGGILEVEVGVPCNANTATDSEIFHGVLPGGQFASLISTGPYTDLLPANAELRKWATKNGRKWAMKRVAAGEEWACRLEIYLTDPIATPDASKWQTEVAYLLA